MLHILDLQVESFVSSRYTSQHARTKEDIQSIDEDEETKVTSVSDRSNKKFPARNHFHVNDSILRGMDLLSPDHWFTLAPGAIKGTRRSHKVFDLIISDEFLVLKGGSHLLDWNSHAFQITFPNSRFMSK